MLDLETLAARIYDDGIDTVVVGEGDHWGRTPE